MFTTFEPMRITYGPTQLDLLPEHAVYIPSSQALVIGDVHIGKTTDLLRQGIQVPIQVALSNPYRITALLKRLQVRSCYFLGDLFHSRYNPEFGLIEELIREWAEVDFVLIRGNHEILSDEDYHRLGLTVVSEKVVEGILLKHHPEPESPVPMMAGHLHPKIRLSAKGRQRASLPVFALQGNCLVLPAFGAMTGGHFIDIDAHQEVYVVAETEVMRLK